MCEQRRRSPVPIQFLVLLRSRLLACQSISEEQMSFLDDDINTMLSGLDSKTITFGSYTTVGYVDSREEVVLQQDGRGGANSSIQEILIKTGELVGLKIGSTITVDGVSKTVRDRLKIDDGMLTKVLVSG